MPPAGRTTDAARQTVFVCRKGFAQATTTLFMGLDELTADVEDSYSDLGEEVTVELDRETRNELAMLSVALEPEETDELLRRALHMFFQTAVDTGRLDFNLRSGHDATYDEYLSGMTFEDMTGGNQFPQAQQKDDRRYQF